MFQCLFPAEAASGSELKNHARLSGRAAGGPVFGDHFLKLNFAPAFPDHGVWPAGVCVLKAEGGNSSSRLIAAHWPVGKKGGTDEKG